MKTKVCNKCQRKLDSSLFYKDSTKKDGLHTQCKKCRQKNDKKYYRKNRQIILISRKQYYQENRGEKIEKAKEHFIKNKEKISLYKREYQQKNKKQLNKKANERKKKRYHNNINYKLRRLLSWRVWSALKGLNKSKSTMELMGCSIEEFKEHLERQFVGGMSWDNHGEWHLDHIQPINTFDLRNHDEQKRCFNFSNLRPLWKEDNLRRPKDGSDLT